MAWILYCEEFSMVSAAIRLVLAALLGAIIGIERGTKRRPAGMRTFSIVCLGSALAMLSNEFMHQMYPDAVDPTRLAAQVISGIGFLGVGTIVVTGKNYVRGLTTAATLWTTATLGIAIGAGFIRVALWAFALIMLIITVLVKFSKVQEEHNRIVNLTLEVEKEQGIHSVMEYIQEKQYFIFSLEKSGKAAVVPKASVITIELDMKKRYSHEELIRELSSMEFVYFVEENR